MLLAAGSWPAAEWVVLKLFSRLTLSFGRRLFLDLLYLGEGKLDRSRTAKDADHDLEGLLVFVDVVDGSVEVGEGSLVDADLLALGELDLHRRLVLRNVGAEEDGANLLLRERDRVVAGSEEAGDARSVLDDVPEIVVEFHLDQDVAWEEDALDGVLLAVAQLGDGLGGNHDPANAVLQAKGRDAALERLADLALKAGVGVDDVPLEILVDRWRKRLGGLLALGIQLYRI